MHLYSVITLSLLIIAAHAQNGNNNNKQGGQDSQNDKKGNNNSDALALNPANFQKGSQSDGLSEGKEAGQAASAT